MFLGPKVALGLDLADLSFLAEGSGGKGPAAAGPWPPSLAVLFPQKLSPVPWLQSQMPRAPIFTASAADSDIQPGLSVSTCTIDRLAHASQAPNGTPRFPPLNLLPAQSSMCLVAQCRDKAHPSRQPPSLAPPSKPTCLVCTAFGFGFCPPPTALSLPPPSPAPSPGQEPPSCALPAPTPFSKQPPECSLENVIQII